MWSCIMKPLAVLASVAALAAPVSGEKLLYSNSLNACQKENGFSASMFQVTLTPNNGSARVVAAATSSIQGKVIFDIRLSAYGYQFLQKEFDPCTNNLPGLCPMVSGKIPFKFNLPVGKENLQQVPGIAYTVPDLDATVRVYVNRSDTRESVACVEADFSNGKTVDLVGVKWATAVIAGLGLVASAIVSGVGHANTAAHVASNSLSLFGYFQAQAILGLTSVGLPPLSLPGLRTSSGLWALSRSDLCRIFSLGIREPLVVPPNLSSTPLARFPSKFRSEACNLPPTVSTFSSVVRL
ncbi:putative flavin carrier protein 3 [Fusarium falciforme]|nr:putative flavin carrier protein 3 [Fusarium falciforme]